MLGKAVKWDLIARNPATQVTDFKEENDRERFLTSTEIRQLLQATKRSQSPWLRAAVWLALETGMRKRELLDLRWSDVNFEAKKMLLPKTKNGKPRHVPMSRRARWLLHKLAAHNPLSEWVFQSTNRAGTAAPVSDLKKGWVRALRLARITDFHFHDLRHTFASHFAMKGGNLFALSQILGHKNPKMTLERYTHLSEKFINDQRQVMDRAVYVSADDRHQEGCGTDTGRLK